MSRSFTTPESDGLMTTLYIHTKNSVYTLTEVPDADYALLQSTNPRFAELKVQPVFGMSLTDLLDWPVGTSLILHILPEQGLKSHLITSAVVKVETNVRVA